MPEYITMLYTGSDIKAALIEAPAGRVAVEEICKRDGIRGVDIKLILEDLTFLDDRKDPPRLHPDDAIALVNDTSQTWLHPEPQHEGDEVFLIVCFTRKERVYVELFLISSPNGYAALLDSDVWPIGMGARAHQKRVDSAIKGEQITEYDLTYKVFQLDGTEVDLGAARSEYANHSEWWMTGVWEEELR